VRKHGNGYDDKAMKGKGKDKKTLNKKRECKDGGVMEEQ
jgi:hypothetical protein